MTVIPFIIFLLTLFCGPLAAAEPAGLQVKDCSMCHVVEVNAVANEGGRHASAVSCLDCHPQHPPTEAETILPCLACHQDEAHFQVGNCKQCHADPHRPLASLHAPSKPVRRECLSCHQDVGRQMAEKDSKHARLFCNRCHTHHKELPSCLECHEPHMATQQAGDCLRCHPAHQPTFINPKGYMPVSFCRPCHLRQARELETTDTKHGGLKCNYCHSGLHPSTTACQDCHGLPHNTTLHNEFRNCLQCHGNPHHLQ